MPACKRRRKRFVFNDKCKKHQHIVLMKVMKKVSFYIWINTEVKLY